MRRSSGMGELSTDETVNRDICLTSVLVMIIAHLPPGGTVLGLTKPVASYMII